MGVLKDELLKAIWHAFTALDLDHSGKVSKSQLKVGAAPLLSPMRPCPTRSTTPGWKPTGWRDHREWQAGMRPSGLLEVEGEETRI